MIYLKILSIDAIITTGGTGLTGRDSTPEAVMALSDKIIDGFGELFRQLSFKKIGTSTIQSRADRRLLLIIHMFFLYLALQALVKMVGMKFYNINLDIRHKPCNLIEIMPRLKEK